ncbi:MAG: glycosyltransferase family 2 protein [Acidobacteriota bacterium]
MAGRMRPSASDGAAIPADGRYDVVLRPEPGARLPQVSIVIPTFNRAEYLAAAVASASAQQGIPIEIMVVNDGGANLPVGLLRELRSGAACVTVVQHRRNLGLGAARNTGASLARGEWLVMLDDDDTLVEGGLAELLHYARIVPSARFIFGDHLRQMYEAGRPNTIEQRSGAGERLEELHLENPIICGSFIIKRQLFESLRGYREDLPVHEDYNLHVRVFRSSPTAHVDMPVCVYHCRDHIPRLNRLRLCWFATCAFNHAVYRSLFDQSHDSRMALAQREYQYAHLARALAEGCPPEAASDLVRDWWSVLASQGMHLNARLDRDVAARICPELLQS